MPHGYANETKPSQHEVYLKDSLPLLNEHTEIQWIVKSNCTKPFDSAPPKAEELRIECNILKQASDTNEMQAMLVVFAMTQLEKQRPFYRKNSLASELLATAGNFIASDPDETRRRENDPFPDDRNFKRPQKISRADFITSKSSFLFVKLNLCSAILNNFLGTIESNKSLTQGGPTRKWVRAVRKNFGSYLYIPDNSCISV